MGTITFYHIKSKFDIESKYMITQQGNSNQINIQKSKLETIAHHSGDFSSSRTCFEKRT